nr:toll/interleukin-1 receptor domain-containing protein [Nitrosomonas nitrosa]
MEQRDESTKPASRTLVFLSHANPEDNLFTIWLGARLASAGYYVWSDVTKLIGGEYFWKDIEEAIRSHSSKVISIVSRPAVRKDGFLNELSVALSVEGTRGLDEFVIPVRLDDIPFGDVPAQIHRKNLIDFTNGWQTGLAKLIKKLEQDGIQRDLDGRSDQLTAWSKHFLEIDARFVEREEMVLTNWLPVKYLPSIAHVLKIDPARQGNRTVDREGSWPIAVLGEYIVSFAGRDDLENSSACAAYGYVGRPKWSELIEGSSQTLPALNGRPATNVLIDLLKQAWGRAMARKGCLSFEMPGNRLAWYLPISDQGITRVQFTDLAGQQRKKALQGRSEVLKANWHLAVVARPVVRPTLQYVLSLHVVFTEDGRTPVGDAKRMHAMRRRFCKNWWQKQWRDLLLAYLTFVTQGETYVELKVSHDESISVPVRPSLFLSKMTFLEGVATPIEPEDPPEPTDLADDLDEFDEDAIDEALEEVASAGPPPGGTQA